MTATNNALVSALVKTQLELTPPVKDKVNPRFKSRYCSLDSIYEACRIPLAKNGLSLSHSVEFLENKYSLRTTLYHVSGEQINTVMPMFVSQLDSQGFASALTYARKYAVCSLLGLPTEEDDDGNEATSQQTVSRSAIPTKSNVCLSDAQCEEIDQLIEDDMELLNRILTGYEVTKLKNIPADKFDKIMKVLRERKGK